MANTAADVFARIDGFTVGNDISHNAFLDRLGQETGWDRETTTRAWQEYLRFIALVVSSPDQARTPSKPVDLVWHLHLTYSRSYWEDLQSVLGHAPHHEPASPGDTSTRRQYLETIRAYSTAFGAVPPSDLWPQSYPASGRLGLQQLAFAAAAVVALVLASMWIMGPTHPFTLAVLLVGAAIVLGAGVLSWRSAGPVDHQRAGCGVATYGTCGGCGGSCGGGGCGGS